MKRIAIWGFGPHGRNLAMVLNNFCYDQYQITRVYDQKYLQINQEVSLSKFKISEVFPPGHLPEDFRDGLFDAVVIGIYAEAAAVSVKEMLKQHHIPVVVLPKPASYQISEHTDFDKFPVVRDGYHHQVLNNMYGVSLQIFDLGLFDALLMFDHDWNLNCDFWLHYHYASFMEASSAIPLPETNMLRNNRLIKMPGEYAVLARPFSDNYWHFTFEVLYNIFLLENYGFRGRYVLKQSPAATELLALLGIPSERILWLDDFSTRHLYEFEKVHLIVADTSNDRRSSAPVLVEASQSLLQAAMKLHPDFAEKAPSKIYFKRIGTRQLLNSEEFLQRLGFVTIIPEETSVAEQILYFHYADIVLTPHGAGSTNSLYMRPGTVFIETFPCNYIHYYCIDTLYTGGVHHMPLVENDNILGKNDPDSGRNYRLRNIQIENAVAIAEKLINESKEK